MLVLKGKELTFERVREEIEKRSEYIRNEAYTRVIVKTRKGKEYVCIKIVKGEGIIRNVNEGNKPFSFADVYCIEFCVGVLKSAA